MADGFYFFQKLLELSEKLCTKCFIKEFGCRTEGTVGASGNNNGVFVQVRLNKFANYMLEFRGFLFDSIPPSVHKSLACSKKFPAMLEVINFQEDFGEL